MRRPALIVLLSLLCAAAGASADEGPQVEVTSPNSHPGLGEVIRLTYTFSGAGAGGNVRAPSPLPLKNLTLVGGPSTSTQIVFMNGDLRRSVALTYYLRAQGTGGAEVGETTWTIGDKTVKAVGYVFEVGPGRSAQANAPPEEEAEDDPFFGGMRPRVPTGFRTAPRRELLLEYLATPDKTTAYVGEEITIHYELLTQADIEGLEYLEPPKFPGCWAEDLEKPEKPSGHRGVYEGRNVTRFTLLKKAVAGLAPGTVTIPEARIRLAVRGGSDPWDPFSAFQRQIVERATKPIALKILPIPGEAGFKGPVGKFELSAKVDRPKVAVGEAVTLKVRLSGGGNLRSAAVEAPKLEIPNARLYPPTTKTDTARTGGKPGGSTEWSYVLVPLSPGPMVIPPASLAVFDPSEKHIVKKSTSPIAIVVEGGPEPVTKAAGAPGPTPVSQIADTLDPTALSPTPVAGPKPGGTTPKVDLSSIDMKRGTVTIPLWLVAAVPGALLLVGGTVLVARRRRRGTPLRAALAPEPGETKERAAARVDRALRDWLARYDVPEDAGPSAILERLAERGMPESRRSEVKALLDDLEFLRFAPQLGEYEGKIREVRDLAARVLK